MRRLVLLFFVVVAISVAFIGCQAEEVEFQSNDCKKQPAFIRSVGFNPARTAFSTSEKKTKGLILMEINQPGDTSGGGRRVYQHPSWSMAGWLGPLQVDPQGNCFVAPIPVVNILDNPPAQQNHIYRVDAQTGVMSEYVKLPLPDSIPPENPYGILGFAYLCEADVLYAATVLGSSRQAEKGCIYAIQASTGEILDVLRGIDAIGLGISYVSGKRVLYAGLARQSEVWSISLASDGRFSGKPAFALSLDGMGPRGDDKARRIRFDKNNRMVVQAIEFNFNLTAPTEKQESVFTFQFNETSSGFVPAN